MIGISSVPMSCMTLISPTNRFVFSRYLILFIGYLLRILINKKTTDWMHRSSRHPSWRLFGSHFHHDGTLSSLSPPFFPSRFSPLSSFLSFLPPSHFVFQVVDSTVIDNIHTVTGGIQNSFRNNLAGLTWIDANSKVQANFKLSSIKKTE